MRSLTAFLVEETTEEKLKHLEHPEDHPIKSGEAGFHHAFNTLKSTAEHLQGHENGMRLMTKYDGAPSVVFGHHPETGKFFVASKSAFNKNPKINYTAADIEKNHGHAPGLVSKLKAALVHLKKVAPGHGVYQGDFLYNKADNDVTADAKGNYHFKPQLINYQAKKGSEQAKAIERAKIGFYVHTGYKGDTLEHMKADYTPDTKGFKQNPDVHMHHWNQGFDPKRAKYSDAEHAAFKKEMNAAGNVYKNTDRGATFGVGQHMYDHLSTYINSTVRNGTSPTSEGLTKHIQLRGNKEAEKVKTDKSKAEKLAAAKQHIDYVKANKKHVDDLLKIHQHLAAAKNALMPALQRGDVTGYKYSINGQDTHAEGTVGVTKDNRPTKFVNRGEGGFAQSNLNKGGFGK